MMASPFIIHFKAIRGVAGQLSYVGISVFMLITSSMWVAWTRRALLKTPRWKGTFVVGIYVCLSTLNITSDMIVRHIKAEHESNDGTTTFSISKNDSEVTFYVIMFLTLVSIIHDMIVDLDFEIMTPYFLALFLTWGVKTASVSQPFLEIIYYYVFPILIGCGAALIKAFYEKGKPQATRNEAVASGAQDDEAPPQENQAE